MNCSQCKVALERKVVRGRTTEIDRCPQCGGIWFDAGEIAELLGSRERAVIPPDARVDAQRRCPRCDETLVVFGYPGTLTVAEGCRRCAGIWLDAGEFEEIRKAKRVVPSAAGRREPERVPPPRRDPSPPSRLGTGGVKESLIRFIDRAISTMLDGMKSS